MFKLVLEKAEEPEIKLPTSVGWSKKQESSRKTSTSASLTIAKPLNVQTTTNCGKFWKRWEYQTTWPATWETCMYAGRKATVRTEHGTMDWFQMGKGLCQGCLLSPCLFNFYALWETLGWMKHKLESGLLGEISMTSDMQMTPLLWLKVKNKEPFGENETREWKSWLKVQHSGN